jgi:hypothetical protein
MAKQPKSEPKSKLEKIAETYPRYSSLLQKQSELLARQEAVHAEARPLAERGKRAMASWQAQLPKPKAKPIVRHAGAVALLDGLLPDQPADELNPPPPRPSWDGEVQLRELSAEAESLVEALKLIAEPLKRARREYSLRVAKERGEAYKLIVSNIIDIAVGLGTALEAHTAFLNEMRLDAAGWRYLRPIDTTAFGEINEDGSIIRSLILNAVEQGHVSGGQIPKWNPALTLSMLQNLGD